MNKPFPFHRFHLRLANGLVTNVEAEFFASAFCHADFFRPNPIGLPSAHASTTISLLIYYMQATPADGTSGGRALTVWA